MLYIMCCDFRSKGQASEYENVESDENDEAETRAAPAATAVQKPSKIPRLMGVDGKPATSTPSSANGSPAKKKDSVGSNSNSNSKAGEEEVELDEFEEEERRLLAMESQVTWFGHFNICGQYWYWYC